MNHEDPRYEDTVYTIEATDYESLSLWREYHEEVRWEEDCHGLGVTIGSVGEAPVHVSVAWAKLNGKRVAFVEPTSQIVDWVMVDRWIKSSFPMAKGRHTNPMNFGHCLSYVRTP